MTLPVSIHQPETFPWLSFFDKIDQVKIFVLLDTVQFEKDYFQNRFKVLDQAGRLKLLTIPVKKSSFETKIKDQEIDYRDRHFKKTLNCLQESYRKAPYFQEVMDFIEPILHEKGTLGRFNSSLILAIAGYLNFSTDIKLASDLKLPETKGGTSVNLQICKHLKADFYLSGPNGRSYLDTKLFRSQNIQVGYHCFDFKPYRQLQNSEFIPALSIVDCLFNHGKTTIDYIRKGRNPYEVDLT